MLGQSNYEYFGSETGQISMFILFFFLLSFGQVCWKKA